MEVDNKVVVDHIKKQISKLRLTILATAILICIPLFFLCYGFFLSDSDVLSNNTMETSPSDHTQQAETTDAETEPIANTQTDPSPTTFTEEPTFFLTHGTEKNTRPSSPDSLNEPTYVIDTIAHISEDFCSLIVTNDGVVYYLDRSVVFNSADNVSLDIETILAQPLEYSYLAYDPYHDIVYLLTGESLICSMQGVRNNWAHCGGMLPDKRTARYPSTSRLLYPSQRPRDHMGYALFFVLFCVIYQLFIIYARLQRRIGADGYAQNATEGEHRCSIRVDNI